MGRYLDLINKPADVKLLTPEQVQTLAQEIRDELITVLSKTGGHLGPNLGVVELTIAMHRVFDCPKDRFVWDVSHQVYVHKLLTGRRQAFAKIRQTGGPMGFAFRSESPYDCFGAGHAGTALSAALGMAAARDLAKSDEHVVCVLGDAALTNGITFEALNNIAHSTKRLIVILNDNEWSIAKNVGAISDYLNRIVTHPRYQTAHKKLEHLINRLGPDIAKVEQKVEEAVKSILVPSVMFEEFGLRYIGPMDGHNLPKVVETLEWAKKQETPVLLHVLTKKGKGYEKALEDPATFHGCGPFDIATGKSPAKKPGTAPNYQDVFGEAMVRFCEVNNKLLGITAAMPGGTSLGKLHKAKPERFFDVGIAEEHAVIFAAGMATMGYRPVCAIYSTFLQRAYDCIIHDVALQNLDVIFCMDRAGLSANDGPTHHGVFDIAYARCIPNATLMAPKDEDELADMLWTALQHHGPIFIRYPRGPGEGVTIKEHPALLPIGKAEVLQHGTDVAVLYYGAVGGIARETVASLQAEGLSVALINARFCKPLDVETVEKYGRIAKVICTIENHVLMGGFGSTVLETLEDARITTPVARVGWPDKFLEHASSNKDLEEKYGLTAKVAIARVKELLAERTGHAATDQKFRVITQSAQVRVRLDTLLVNRQLAESREKAKRLILAGAVRVNSQMAGKASDLAEEDAALEVIAPERYVSRGGYKLEAALDTFHIECHGAVCLDIGASTGGFTDCLLQHGATRVHAVDVGKGQLHWRLRQDPRVTVYDDCNARNLAADTIKEPVDMVSVDVSFISLTKVLPAAVALLKPGGRLLALIKPQFEAGRKEVGKGGVVRDTAVHQRVVDAIREFATKILGLEFLGLTESPLLGPAGNKEFLIALRKP